MIRTVEGSIDERGEVHLLEPVFPTSARRVLVMILDEDPANHPIEGALLSESALAEDWSHPEEDAAWAHLRSAT